MGLAIIQTERGKRGTPARYYLVQIDWRYKPTTTVNVFDSRKEAESTAKRLGLTIHK